MYPVVSPTSTSSLVVASLSPDTPFWSFRLLFARCLGQCRGLKEDGEEQTNEDNAGFFPSATVTDPLSFLMEADGKAGATWESGLFKILAS